MHSATLFTCQITFAGCLNLRAPHACNGTSVNTDNNNKHLNGDRNAINALLQYIVGGAEVSLVHTNTYSSSELPSSLMNVPKIETNTSADVGHYRRAFSSHGKAAQSSSKRFYAHSAPTRFPNVRHNFHSHSTMKVCS